MVLQRSRQWMTRAILVSALVPARGVGAVAANEEVLRPVVLTNQQPAGSFPVAREIIASKPIRFRVHYASGEPGHNPV